MTTVPLLFLAAACAGHLPPVADPGRVEVIDFFIIEYHDRRIAGQATAVIEGDHVTVEALSQTGTELFRYEAKGEQVRVTAADREWVKYVEKLPLARDLKLVHTWSCPQGRCVVEGGTLRESKMDGGGVKRRVRNDSGWVEARIWDQKAEITDPFRGYVARLAGETIGVD